MPAPGARPDPSILAALLRDPALGAAALPPRLDVDLADLASKPLADVAAEQRRTQERLLAAGLVSGSTLDALRTDRVTIRGTGSIADGDWLFVAAEAGAAGDTVRVTLRGRR